MSAIPVRYEVKGTSAAVRREFLDSIRLQDKRELWAGGRGLSSLATAMETLSQHHSHHCLLQLRSLVTGRLLAVGGIVPFGDSCGAPWFLCTVHAEKEPKVLLAGIREMSDQWADRFVYQEHRTWVSNTMHQKLIRKLGYTIHPEVDPNGFAKFTKGVTPCATP